MSFDCLTLNQSNFFVILKKYILSFKQYNLSTLSCEKNL